MNTRTTIATICCLAALLTANSFADSRGEVGSAKKPANCSTISRSAATTGLANSVVIEGVVRESSPHPDNPLGWWRIELIWATSTSRTEIAVICPNDPGDPNLGDTYELCQSAATPGSLVWVQGQIRPIHPSQDPLRVFVTDIVSTSESGSK